MHPANEWWYYNITSSLSGWAHSQNDSWTYCNLWILFLRCLLNHCYKKICETWHPSRSQSWCSLFPLASLPRHWIMANIKSFWTCELLPVISVSFLQIFSIIRDNLLLIQGENDTVFKLKITGLYFVAELIKYLQLESVRNAHIPIESFTNHDQFLAVACHAQGNFHFWNYWFGDITGSCEKHLSIENLS